MTSLLDGLDDADRGRLKPAAAAFVAPMLATLTAERFSDPDWIFERKLDGVRAVAVRDGSGASLWSRNEKPMDATYPELVDAVAAHVPAGTVLDDEVVAFTGAQTSFERLQARIGLHDPDAARASGVPVFLYVFDLLVVHGQDITALPLRLRKRLLRAAVDFRARERMSAPQYRRRAYLRIRAGAAGGLVTSGPTPLHRGRRSADWLKLNAAPSRAGHRRWTTRSAPAPVSAPCSSATTTAAICGTPGRSAPASTTGSWPISAPASATCPRTARPSVDP